MDDTLDKLSVLAEVEIPIDEYGEDAGLVIKTTAQIADEQVKAGAADINEEI